MKTLIKWLNGQVSTMENILIHTQKLNWMKRKKSKRRRRRKIKTKIEIPYSVHLIRTQIQRVQVDQVLREDTSVIAIVMVTRDPILAWETSLGPENCPMYVRMVCHQEQL